MDAIKKQARLAGLFYVLVVIIAPIGILYVPGKLIVRGDATATAGSIRASESLFRIGIVSEIVGAILMAVVVVMLFWLFRALDEKLAWLLLIFGALISAPMAMLNAVNYLAALVIVGGPGFLSAFTQPELDSLTYLFLRMHDKTIVVAEIFWGLWLFPFGILVTRSGYIPRFLGYLLFVAGAGYLIEAFAILLLPRYAAAIAEVTFYMFLGELPIVFWLLIWGAREQRPRASAA